MAKYGFLIMVNAKEGQDDALNEFLDKHHLPEVLQTEGFKAVTRYSLPPGEAAANPKATHQYMHLYEIETDDLARTKAALGAGHATRTPMPPSLDLGTIVSVFYKAM